MSGMCEGCCRSINWLLSVPRGGQTKKRGQQSRKNYMTAWSHQPSVWLFLWLVVGATVPVPHCRSEIFCWWCPPPGRQRQTPPGWVRGGGLHFLASTVGTAKQNRHAHTHTIMHSETCRYTSTHTHAHVHKNKHTTEKQKMKEDSLASASTITINFIFIAPFLTMLQNAYKKN